ncbi:hypothetical protein MTF65_18815 [Streptomyces sp. APSN-46.1]|uniref:hypothetical protein n=1 Tax=Streptomyces sp. APSN-46.1 TaxID=2929049 RepID=UPI001FB31086|nr:hypothetical protein [Streptomyces sp. APSN-46.1]MCJ1679356.1 hypothetical protein [Streptomyces sp. APSN-46.1]
MPRKAPSQVRSDLPRPPSRWDSRAVIPGISGKALADIARVERYRYAPGAAWHALRHWRRLVYERGPWVMYPSFVSDYPCCDPPWIGEHRQILEEFLAVLPRRARRELRAVLAPLDARFLARTLNDPYAAPGDPWWRRRLETP